MGIAIPACNFFPLFIKGAQLVDGVSQSIDKSGGYFLSLPLLCS